MLSREPRNLKKLKAALRAEFALKQRFERIDWEEDVLIQKVLEFEGQAKLPELPTDAAISVIYEEPAEKAKPRARRRQSK